MIAASPNSPRYPRSTTRRTKLCRQALHGPGRPASAVTRASQKSPVLQPTRSGTSPRMFEPDLQPRPRRPRLAVNNANSSSTRVRAGSRTRTHAAIAAFRACQRSHRRQPLGPLSEAVRHSLRPLQRRLCDLRLKADKAETPHALACAPPRGSANFANFVGTPVTSSAGRRPG